MNERIQTLLSTLGSVFVRTEPTSTVKSKEDLKKFPERPYGTRGVTYHVFEGPLKGCWTAWGDDAELFIFDRMSTTLEEVWTRSMSGVKLIGSALRAVNK